jgi:uncharacterized protein YggU (UPF0235/DUF167 family)
MKPVAYGMLTFCKNCGKQNPYAVKELTDKEILKVHINTPFIDGYLNKNLIEFARAILRKAQEK